MWIRIRTGIRNTDPDPKTLFMWIVFLYTGGRHLSLAVCTCTTCAPSLPSPWPGRPAAGPCWPAAAPAGLHSPPAVPPALAPVPTAQPINGAKLNKSTEQ